MKSVCDFLSIGQINFETKTIFNQSGVPKSNFVSKILKIMRPAERKLIPFADFFRMKKFLKTTKEKIKGYNLKKQEMDSSVKKELIGYFKEDIADLEKIMKINLSGWVSE